MHKLSSERIIYRTENGRPATHVPHIWRYIERNTHTHSLTKNNLLPNICKHRRMEGISNGLFEICLFFHAK